MNLLAPLQRAGAVAAAIAESLSSVWVVYQLLVIAACVAIAWGAARAVRARYGEVTRRGVGLVMRRAFWIVLALLLWAAYLAMGELTWPSRSYLVGIAANLATAWVVISILARAIRNRLLFWVVSICAFAVAALSILGLLQPTLAALDSVQFSLGETSYSLLSLVKALLFVTVLLWLATRAGKLTELGLKRSSDLTPSATVLISKIVRIVLIIVAVFVAMSLAGIDLTGIAVLSGAIGVGIGFGLQKVVSNLVSGFILLLDKSIKPGDVIEIGDTFGWIGSLGARYVSVVTRDGKEYLIPNEDLITQQVINWSFSNAQVRIEVRFGVSYEADPHKVRELCVEAVRELKRVLPKPDPVCHVYEFGDSSVNYLLRFWIEDPALGVSNIRGQVLLALWDAFKREGIEIPYPKRDVHITHPVEVTLAEKPKRARTRKT